MSTQPTTLNQDALMSECVTTDYLGCLDCPVCNTEFVPERKDQKQCSKRCANVAAHRRRDEQRAANKKLKHMATNIAFAHLHRDCSIGFDGRYEGPLNQCFTIVVGIRKDQGYHPMPIDVHVKPMVTKHGPATPEDHDWATRQKAFPHTLAMPRLFSSFCAHCVEMVIDKTAKSVRVTRGVYLPIDHECNRVRVYDLAGKLLEVKNL